MAVTKTNIQAIINDLAKFNNYGAGNPYARPEITQRYIDILNRLVENYSGSSFIPTSETGMGSNYQAALNYLKMLNPSSGVTETDPGHPGSILQYPNDLVSTGTGGSGSIVSPSSSATSIAPKESDLSRIEKEGERQYGQLMSEAELANSMRKSRRAELAKLLTDQADTMFLRKLPGMAEDANAGGIYTGTGFSDSLARERSNQYADVANALAQQGLSDTDALIAARLGALGSKLGFQSSGLSRDFSLADWDKQAQLSKEIGLMSQPSGGGGKGETGMLLGGIGSVVGAAAGGVPGALIGSQIGSGLSKSSQVATAGGRPVTYGQTSQGGGK